MATNIIYDANMDPIISQDNVERENVEVVVERDLDHLVVCYCTGLGLEIGPGEKPYSKDPKTVYVDRFEVGERIINADADDMPLDSNRFDFVISSHCLEHCHDTIKALKEWIRVGKNDGILFLVLPHKERTFDEGRDVTTLDHHIEDWKKEVGEKDAQHFEDFAKHSISDEWLHAHNWIDEARHPDGSWNFKWIVDNGNMHYHAWTQNEIIDLLKYLGCVILGCIERLRERRDSFAVIARIKKS